MKYPKNSNGKSRPQSKEWQHIRAELMQLKMQFNLSDDEFHPLSPNEDFKGVEEKIYQTFCHLENDKSRPIWLWEHFKQAEFAVFDLPKLPETYLSELIDHTESIWFGALASYRETSKIWWYAGKILAIQKLLAETHFLDEVYFVSIIMLY